MKRLLSVALISVVAVGLAASPASAKAKHKPSQSCLTALNAAESVFTTSGVFATHVSEFFTSLSDAATTASNDGDASEFIDGVTAASNTLASATKDATAEIDVSGPAFRAAAARCRAGK